MSQSTSERPPGSEPDKPLIVDLDGTLIRNELPPELFVLIARWKPWLLPLAVFRMLRSRPQTKAWMVSKIGHHIDPEHLPYDPDVLALIEDHCANGGKAELVSGSDHVLVERIASHIGTFVSAQGSYGTTNLVSAQKASYLTERHPEGFHYVGNSGQDIKVWRAAAAGYGIRAPSAAYDLTHEDGAAIVEMTVHKSRSLAPLVEQLRLHHWAANLLVFAVPIFLAPQLGTADWLLLLQAFLCFCMMASGTYLLDDLFAIPDNRADPARRHRPLASGRLSVTRAAGIMGLFMIGSILWATQLGLAFMLVLLAYLITSIAYSLHLKRIAGFNIVIPAVSLCLRVIAGAAVVGALPAV
ncbi:UbiA family prenyltransferase [Henriciella sp.]|uniref:UbiA family prenyltransferase n=1 Tax=Henriciella sp. TaxID=1968823 RepID=UPI00263553C8|nr:UbiA family prenyltransferase [Henriciella sp.]